MTSPGGRKLVLAFLLGRLEGQLWLFQHGSVSGYIVSERAWCAIPLTVDSR